jgi:hypothetical protein
LSFKGFVEEKKKEEKGEEKEEKGEEKEEKEGRNKLLSPHVRNVH